MKKLLLHCIPTLIMALSLLGPGPLSAKDASKADGSYDACASSIYAELKETWTGSEASPNFWQVGNVFDTLIDYILLYESDTQKELAAIAPAARTLYQNGLASNACMWDDLGWWGIAAAKMSKHVENPQLKAEFKDIAKYMWDTMHAYAPYTYERAEEGPYRKYFQPMAPRYGGGIWNYCWGRNGDPAKCWTKQGSACGGGCDPTGGNKLCGYQNTVTNSLYLVLSLRLYELETDVTATEHYLEAATMQLNWFRSWFNGADPKETLLVSQGGGGMLVRERASTYYDKSWVNGYNPSTFWAGDQGLVLGGLVDYFMAVSNDMFPQTVAVGIVKAIPGSMTDQNGYLLPWKPPTGDLCQWDCGDYSCGPGVFMRYLLYAFQNDKKVRSEVLEPGYKSFIKTNADQACKAGPQDFCSLCGHYGESELFRLLNYLATLNAAKAILG